LPNQRRCVMHATPPSYEIAAGIAARRGHSSTRATCSPVFDVVSEKGYVSHKILLLRTQASVANEKSVSSRRENSSQPGDHEAVRFRTGRRQDRGRRRRGFCCSCAWGGHSACHGRAGAWPTRGGRRSGGYGSAELLKEGRSAMLLFPNDSCGMAASDVTKMAQCSAAYPHQPPQKRFRKK